MSSANIVAEIQFKLIFLKRKFSVSLKKDFIFQFHIYFSASFAFYFVVSYPYSQTSTMISFNIETLNSSENLPLYTSFIKFDVAITTFKNLLKMVVLEERLNKTDIEKVG